MVYLAMDAQQGSWRALKVPAFDRMGDERTRARFRRECETALRLRHPHFVRAHDADPEHPYTPWLAFEVCEAGHLGDWLARHGVMPAVLAIEVMVQICSALAAAHRAGVAQRRLEPRDVLVDRHGKCRLKDFRTVPGVTGGLKADSADLRDDIVGAGTLLHLLVVGRPPTEGHVSTSMPDPLRGIVHRALQRGRGMGYPDAASLGRDLEAAMLEVSLPASGELPSLADASVRLPDTLEALFDPDASFPDLERAARWAADPAEAPPQVEAGTAPILTKLVSGARAEAPRPEPTPAPAPAAPPPPLPRPVARPLPEAVREAAAAPFIRGTPAPSPYRSVPHGRLTIDEIQRRGDITPAPVRRSTDDSAYVPDYLVEEPTRPERSEAWREPTPTPAPRQPVVEERRPDGRLIVAGVLLFCVLLGGFVFHGARQVGEARATVMEAGENLTSLVARSGAVVNDLAGRGADRQRLEEAFFAYSEARGPARHVEAERFVVLLLAEAARVGVDPNGPVQDPATQRISDMGAAQARYRVARESWSEAARGFPGALPVLLGLAKGPPR